MKTALFIIVCCVNAALIVAVGYFLFIFWDPLMNGGFVVVDTGLVNGKDSVAYAAEIGRLDTVSLLVGYLGLFMVVFTFGGIWYSHHDVRNAARAVATEVASKEAKNVAEKQLDDYLEAGLQDDLSDLFKERPDVFENTVRSILRKETLLLNQIVNDVLAKNWLAGNGHISPGSADDFARVVDEDEDHLEGGE